MNPTKRYEVYRKAMTKKYGEDYYGKLNQKEQSKHAKLLLKATEYEK